MLLWGPVCDTSLLYHSLQSVYLLHGEALGASGAYSPLTHRPLRCQPALQGAGGSCDLDCGCDVSGCGDCDHGPCATLILYAVSTPVISHNNAITSKAKPCHAAVKLS